MVYIRKLSEQEKEAIYKEFLTGQITIEDLAEKYKTSSRTICTILTNKMNIVVYKNMTSSIPKRTEDILYSLFYNGEILVKGEKYSVCMDKKKKLIRAKWERKLFLIKEDK